MPSGRFEQEKETMLLNDPACGTAVTWTLRDWPRAMVNADGAAVKFTPFPGLPQFVLYATGLDI